MLAVVATYWQVLCGICGREGNAEEKYIFEVKNRENGVQCPYARFYTAQGREEVGIARIQNSQGRFGRWFRILCSRLE